MGACKPKVESEEGEAVATLSDEVGEGAGGAACTSAISGREDFFIDGAGMQDSHDVLLQSLVGHCQAIDLIPMSLLQSVQVNSFLRFFVLIISS